MSREKILIVDDEGDLCKLIAHYFMLEDYRVLTAADGLEALELIEKEQPDLVVSDIRMPHCDGFCLIEEMNKRSSHPVPVIFISGYFGSSGDLNRLSQYPNFLKYFTKPFKSKILVGEVKNYFNTYSGSSGLQRSV